MHISKSRSNHRILNENLSSIDRNKLIMIWTGWFPAFAFLGFSSFFGFFRRWLFRTFPWLFLHGTRGRRFSFFSGRRRSICHGNQHGDCQYPNEPYIFEVFTHIFSQLSNINARRKMVNCAFKSTILSVPDHYHELWNHHSWRKRPYLPYHFE